MWHCAKCGSDNEDRFKFCWSCGTPSAVADDAATDTNLNTTPNNTHSTHQSAAGSDIQSSTVTNVTRSNPPDYGTEGGEMPQRSPVMSRQVSLSANPAFPLSVPTILSWSESRIRTISAILGIAIGLLSSVLIFLLASRESMLGHYFNLREISVAVPILISIMFFWGAALCVFRFFRQRALERISHRSLLLDSVLVVNSGEVSGLMAELDPPVARFSPLLRRIHGVLQQWLIRAGLQDADVILQQQAISDEESVRAGYTLIRTFVWALPVLGLIGTVVGVAFAVGGFAQFLGGDIEDVAVIKRNLVGVTSGLSYAFLTTLHGLLTSLLLMLSASALQTREEKMYSIIQQNVVDLLLPALQRAIPERHETGALDVSGLRENLVEIASGVLSFVQKQSIQLIDAMESRQYAFREQILEWAKTLRSEAESGAGRIGEAIDRAGMRITNAQSDFLQKFESVKADADQKALALLDSVQGQTAAITQQQAGIAQSMEEQNRLIRQNAENVDKLSGILNSGLERQALLQDSINKLDELRLDLKVNEFVEVVTNQTEQVKVAAAALSEVTNLNRDVLTAQANLQTAVSQLHDIELEKTLASFRDSLLELKPVLEGLREPFILQAVPVKTGIVDGNKG